MRVPLVVAALVLTLSPALADTPIAANRAAGFEGGNMTVQGIAVVRPATSPRTGGMEVALQSNGDTGLIAYIPDGNLSDFPDLNSLNGKTVDVSGVIAMDLGQPEIMVTSPRQLAVAGSGQSG